ncbi:MAG: hypothetical protein HYX28_03730 [Candidatus Koribacter versatilis]|uniref:Uncharacterized protein n=1 Tax=Candidatus Korobacter versatilis TaxID=658062 RepID=A0A932A7I4_9BACT|nr:hypothetical protein [Candidatus Koribacter versatilis]
MPARLKRFPVIVTMLLGIYFLMTAGRLAPRSAPPAPTGHTFPRLPTTLLGAYLRPSGFWLLQKTGSGGGEQGNCGDKKKLNDELKEELDPGHKNHKISIGPMVTQGDPTAGTYTPVEGGIWDAILQRAGIKPCETDPKDGKGKDGFLEYVDDSNVLNSGGTRSTFGYFISNGAEGALAADYFLLFSYDRIKDKKTGKILCAFEVFKFGPFPHNRKPGEVHPEADPPEWVFGYAVNGDGCLLPEVPIEVARVSNFANAPDSETVKPGVDDEKKGCRKCHDREKGPGSTFPFPWVKKGKEEKKEEEKKEEKKTESETPGGNKPGTTPKETVPEQPEERPKRIGKAEIPGKKPEGENAGLPSGPTEDTLVGLIVPADTRPEDTITGTVVTNPEEYRNNPALRVIETKLPLIKTAAGATLRGVEALIRGREPQAADGQIVFHTGHEGSLPVTFTREGSTTTLGQSSVPVSSGNPPTGWPGTRGVYKASSIYQRGGTAEISGPFDGNASNTHVQIAGQDANIVAGSPRARYVKVPSNCATGGTDLVVQDGLRSVRFPVSVVSLQISADKLQLRRGETTRYRIVVSGLESLPDSAWHASPSYSAISEIRQAVPGFHLPREDEEGTIVLLLRNLSPQVITMEHAGSGVAAITIHKSDVHGGKFSLDGAIQSKVAGGFTAEAKLVSLLAPAVGTRGSGAMFIGALTGPVRRNPSETRKRSR